MGKYFTRSLKVVSATFLALTLSCLCFESHATAWTTSAAGSINTLSNWTDGTGSPTTFTTPGDTWTVNMPMTMSSGVPWTVGTSGMAAVTVTVASGGSITGSGGAFQLTLNIYGNMSVADTVVANGGACIVTINTYGNFSMTTGAILANGGSSLAKMNVNGNMGMAGGAIIAAGGASKDTIIVKGNFSASGPSFISANGGGAAGCVFFALPTASGTMLVDNTSTGAWQANNVYVDTGCTAQLDGNFSASTGSFSSLTTGYGLTVNGTLICPAADVVNGTGIFKLNGVATLEVANTAGVNGAIINTGTKTFANSANYVFNGSAAQVTGSYLPASLVVPDTITINNSAGVTLTQTTATTGILLFMAGILNTTASYTMSVPGAAASVIGAGASSYVNGTLIKTISGFTSVNYEVGDLDYAPVALTLSTAGTGGSLGLMATNGLHPSVATSGLTTSNMANHYWTITNSAAAGPATVIPKATYNVGDIIGGSNSAFVTQEYKSSVWLSSALATTNTSLPYTSAPNAGVALASLAGDYIFGNLFCGTLPITGTDTVCVGATTTLSDATTGGTWSSTATAVATVGTTGVVTGVSAGTATISYAVGTCSVSTIVTVNPAPTAGAITGDTSVCVGHTDTLRDIVAGGSWSVTNTSLATVGSTGIVTGVSAGIDTVVYTVTNSCGTASVKFHLRVISASACRSGISEIGNEENTGLKIFPNPNEGTFTMKLTLPDDEVVHVMISNIMGQKVSEFTAVSNRELSIKLDPAAGIYFLSATSAQGTYVAKVVVR